jgi:hypothetical protein
VVTKLPPDGSGENGFEPESVTRMRRDLQKSASLLGRTEARWVVDSYYAIQEYRKASGNQIFALDKSGEPHEILTWLATQMTTVETCIAGALDYWSNAYPEARWARSICGIGPVIAAGLLAHLDVTNRPTAGHFWRFAGMEPTLHWIGKDKAKKIVEGAGDLEAAILALSAAVGSKPEAIRKFAEYDKKGKPLKLTAANLIRAGSRRPWNAGLKTLCWKIGESFVKVSANESDLYGKLWLKRKAEEWSRDKVGEYVGAAEAALASRDYSDDTDAKIWLTGSVPKAAIEEYEKTETRTVGLVAQLVKKYGGKPGCNVKMLPPGHIHERAKHYAVKIFLSHYHHVCYVIRYGTDPPVPYAMAKLGHAHYIPVPYLDKVKLGTI